MPTSNSPTAPAWLLGAAAFLVPLVYWPGIYDFPRHPRLLVLQALLLVIVVLIVCRPEAEQLSLRTPVLLPATVYTGVVAASVFWAGNPISAVAQTHQQFVFLLLAAVTATLLRPADIRTVYAFAASAGGIASLIGIAQYFGIDAVSAIPTVGNPSATFGYRNFAASFLVGLIPPVTVFAWTSRRPRRAALWTLAAALMTVFLIYTRTRGAWLGLMGATVAAGVGGLIWLRREGRLRLSVVASRRAFQAAIVLLMIAAAGMVPDRMSVEGSFQFDERKTDAATTFAHAFSPDDARGRLTVWKNTLKMLADSPVAGVGAGNWQHVYPDYDGGEWIRGQTEPQRPHNDFLWILAETGLVGGVAYGWILLSCAALLVRSLLCCGRRESSGEETPDRRPAGCHTIEALGIGLGVLALLGHSLFSFPSERPAASMLIWMGLGSIACLTLRRGSSRPQRSIRFPAALAALALVLGMTLTTQSIFFDRYYLLAMEAWKLGKWPDVVLHADNALRYGPRNHRVLLLKGVALRQSGRPSEAVRALAEAQRQHPPGGNLALGAAYEDLEDFDSAANAYLAESRRFPNSYEASFKLGGLLARRGEWAESAEAYRRALHIQPTDAAGLALGAALVRSGETVEALALYRRAARAPGNVERLLVVGKALEDLGANDDALMTFRWSAEQDSADPRPLNNLGALLGKLGRFPEAEESYIEALRRDPGYARAYHNLGDLYADQNRPYDAAAAYRRFMDLWEGDPAYLEVARNKIHQLKEKE